jgi:hypothetical protein
MKIAVLGTGIVGEAISTKLVALGHEVKMGSRTAGNAKAAAWAKGAGARASHGTFRDAAASGELVFNCTSGAASLEALRSAGAENLGGKPLVDVANPLDFSRGMPPSLTVCNTGSLAEQIQHAFPEARVVKALNTLSASLMVNPARLAGGDHDVLVCGNDADAKRRVTALLTEGFGWKNVVDLGDLTAARGMEAWLLLWIRLYGAFASGNFNLKLVRAG